jgi:hypothetical protein
MDRHGRRRGVTFRRIMKDLHLPCSIWAEIYEWDPTYRERYKICMRQIRNHVATTIADIYLEDNIPRTTGYFQFEYMAADGNRHRVSIHESMVHHHHHQMYILQDFNMVTGFWNSHYVQL